MRTQQPAVAATTAAVLYGLLFMTQGVAETPGGALTAAAGGSGGSSWRFWAVQPGGVEEAAGLPSHLAGQGGGVAASPPPAPAAVTTDITFMLRCSGNLPAAAAWHQANFSALTSALVREQLDCRMDAAATGMVSRSWLLAKVQPLASYDMVLVAAALLVAAASGLAVASASGTAGQAPASAGWPTAANPAAGELLGVLQRAAARCMADMQQLVPGEAAGQLPRPDRPVPRFTAQPAGTGADGCATALAGATTPRRKALLVLEAAILQTAVVLDAGVAGAPAAPPGMQQAAGGGTGDQALASWLQGIAASAALLKGVVEGSGPSHPAPPAAAPAALSGVAPLTFSMHQPPVAAPQQPPQLPVEEAGVHAAGLELEAALQSL